MDDWDTEKAKIMKEYATECSRRFKTYQETIEKSSKEIMRHVNKKCLNITKTVKESKRKIKILIEKLNESIQSVEEEKDLYDPNIGTKSTKRDKKEAEYGETLHIKHLFKEIWNENINKFKKTIEQTSLPTLYANSHYVIAAVYNSFYVSAGILVEANLLALLNLNTYSEKLMEIQGKITPRSINPFFIEIPTMEYILKKDIQLSESHQLQEIYYKELKIAEIETLPSEVIIKLSIDGKTYGRIYNTERNFLYEGPICNNKPLGIGKMKFLNSEQEYEGFVRKNVLYGLTKVANEAGESCIYCHGTYTQQADQFDDSQKFYHQKYIKFKDVSGLH